MNTDQYQQKRQELLNTKYEVEQRLLAVKEAVTKAKREFAATGKRADSDWLTSQETYIRRLGSSAQELQRQLGELKAQRANTAQQGYDQFVHEVMLERMSAEEVADIFREARRRKNISDQ